MTGSLRDFQGMAACPLGPQGDLAVYYLPVVAAKGAMFETPECSTGTSSHHTRCYL